MSLTEATERSTAVTRSDIAARGLDALPQQSKSGIAVSRAAGGVSFATVAEVVDVAKLMSAADTAVPKHLRANPGACLRIVFQAVEWQMSPWAVADKSYVVNDRLAYESQLIHAVIEARAPLRERLNTKFLGEGVDRQCEIVGLFLDGTTRSYTTPKLKDIKVKNSPLWTSDPDQQLFYYASRAWSRRWCPDVIMGLYTKDELRDNPNLGRPDEEPEQGLHARLIGGNVSRDEGHKEGYVEQQLESANEVPEVVVTPSTSLSDLGLKKGTLTALRKTELETVADVFQLSEAEFKERIDNDKAFADVCKTAETLGFTFRVDEHKQDAAQPVATVQAPKNVKEWERYCLAWIDAGEDAKAIRQRWDSERALRNQCGVTSEEREPVQAHMVARCKQLGE